MLKYLITGTGGCGTMYAAKVLQSAGVLCSWEQIFTHSGVEKARKILRGEIPPIRKHVSEIHFPKKIDEIQAESSHLSAPFLDIEELRDTTVVHLVRDPMRTISSLFKMRCLEKAHTLYNLASKFVPEAYQPHLEGLDSYGMYWIAWNERIEILRPDAIIHRVEDGSDALLDKLGIDPGDRVVWKGPINTHTSIHHTFDKIKDPVVREALALLGWKYGYYL